MLTPKAATHAATAASATMNVADIKEEQKRRPETLPAVKTETNQAWWAKHRHDLHVRLGLPTESPPCTDTSLASGVMLFQKASRKEP